MFVQTRSHLFHDPIDMGAPTPSGHPILGGNNLYFRRFSATKIIPEGVTPYQ
jgi:hypothetical protein